MKVRADDEDLEHLYKLQLDQGNINVTKVVWIWAICVPTSKGGWKC